MVFCKDKFFRVTFTTELGIELSQNGLLHQKNYICRNQNH